LKPIKNILFDLDGTLTDPIEGITNCLSYSLERLNFACPPKEQLASYIGPPLRETFATIFDSTDKILIESAVAFYRERFSSVGLYENTVYPGVVDMLDKLKSNSYSLFVATSKVEAYAEKIVQHFSLDSYFIKIHGSQLDGRFDDKSNLLRELIKTHNLSPSQTTMIGDRKHDILAAKKNGISSLGVTYGYGSMEELEEAKADYICHSPIGVVEIIKGVSRY